MHCKAGGGPIYTLLPLYCGFLINALADLAMCVFFFLEVWWVRPKRGCLPLS
jgi:hypothetical protein